MKRIEPTRRFALQVWCALAWRFVVCLIAITLFQGLLAGALTAMLKPTPEGAQTLSRTVSALVGLPLIFAASWEILYRIFDKRIGNNEIVILRQES